VADWIDARARRRAREGRYGAGGPRARARAAACAAALAFGLLGCGAAQPSQRPAPAPSGAASTRVTSNILRNDYAGSASCAPCHAEIYAAWRASPMRLMTRSVDGARIRAPFDGATFHFKDDTAVLSEHDGARFVRLSSPRAADRLYRITRVIGGRVREDFAGVEVAALSPDAPPLAPPGRGSDAELLLPFSYVFDTASFRLKGYSVLVGERPGLRAGGVWNETCIFCHNTTPYFDSMWGALYGPGAPPYQGEVVDRVLPRARRWRFDLAPAGGGALAAAVDAEVAAVGGGQAARASDPRATLAHGIGELRTHFAARHFVEVGIGCEACHGGSREHVANPRVIPDFAPRAPFVSARPEGTGEVTRAELVNRTCARCHQVLFSHYPFTWEGGARRHDPGGSSITSGEARDFLMGGCARQMSCATCHDPHGADDRAALDRLGTVAGNEVCARCHGQYAAPAALRAHSHHDPGGAGASCIACHMPRKNMGLGYALTRYHRIGSPDEPVRVERDRPLECALCHADKTVADLVGAMERWWGKRYDRGALATLYGDLGARPLEATLARGKAHEQAVALATLGAAGDQRALPGVARQVTNPFPLVRYYATRALAALGAGCAIDLDRPTADIAAAVRACVPRAFTGDAGAPVPAGAAARGADAPDED
jgi:predicted CXXCH cytochrome family protein